jgi:tetratricopeptide (TPR) repeat protein
MIEVDAKLRAGVTQLRTKKNYKQALDLIDKALAAEPNHAGLHNLKGSILQVSGEYAKAIAGYDQAAALQPAFNEAHANRINARLALRRPPCPLAFLAGADPNGGLAAIKHTSATVGFTGFLPGAADKDYTATEVDEQVTKTQQSILKVFDYLSEVGVDPDILRRIYEDIPDGQVRYISDEDLLSIGVSVYDDASNQLIDGSTIKKRTVR